MRIMYSWSYPCELATASFYQLRWCVKASPGVVEVAILAYLKVALRSNLQNNGLFDVSCAPHLQCYKRLEKQPREKKILL